MKFKVGDKVSVLDDNISGIITKISINSITVESSDGFEFEFEAHELILSKGQSMSSSFFSEQSLEDVIKEKEVVKNRNTPKIKPKERTQPAMEVDLHIHQLTNSFKHLSNYEMLTIQMDTAKRQLEFAIRKRIQKVVFIHGVGEGILKTELEYLFGKYDNIKYYDADYQKYGLGATEIYIYQNVNP
jgi:dsDNA-specific endonuclease/ATPase MutS2